MHPRLSIRLLALWALCSSLGSGCTDNTSPSATADGGADSGADSDTDIDTDADTDSDNGTDTGCSEGFQDNDNDDECLPDCETAGLECVGNAHCDDSGGAVTCVCDDGYQDHDDDGSCLASCDTADLECAQNAHCNDDSGIALCECDDGYQDNDEGGDCLPTCETAGDICGDHGQCDDSDGEPTCVCETGYAGDDCAACDFGYQDNDDDETCLFNCDLANLDCSGNSHCDETSGEAVCACDEGYSGDDCNSCNAGFQDNDSNGECLPDCSTAGDVCIGPGSCDDSSGEADCVCEPGYQDNNDDEECLPDCETAALDCPSGQSCEDWYGEALCACPLGYAGEDCAECAAGFEDVLGECLPDHEWTVIVYMNADNDLESEAYGNLDEMSAVGSSADVHVVALLDTYIGGGQALYVTDGDYDIVDWLGEPDMGDWHTLWELGIWAVRSYPAKHYALLLWDHGDGWTKKGPDDAEPRWKAFSEDMHGVVGPISIAGGELSRALTGITDAINGAKIDIVGFDACLMGMWEVARAAAPYADYLVASSENEPAAGWPYNVFLADLVADPTMATAALCTSVVDAYHDASSYHFTLAATDLTDLTALDDEVSTLADAIAGHPELFAEIEEVRAATQVFGDPHFKDLRDFAIRIGALTDAPSEVATAAGVLSIGLDVAIVHGLAQDSHPDAHGLSIYLPPIGGGMDCGYLDVDASWSAATTWDDFLVDFTEATCGP